MALGDPYATLAELKSYLSVPDAVDDAELQAALVSASREIEVYCDRQFNQATTATARVYASTSAAAADVHDFWTTAGLVVATGTGDGVFATVWAASDYQLEPLNGMAGAEAGWPYYRLRGLGRSLPGDGRVSVQVTAQWGWAAVPALVRQACLVLASETFKLSDAPFGVFGYGDYGPVRVKNSPIACRMLAAYRRHPVLVG